MKFIIHIGVGGGGGPKTQHSTKKVTCSVNHMHLLPHCSDGGGGGGGGGRGGGRPRGWWWEG